LKSGTSHPRILPYDSFKHEINDTTLHDFILLSVLSRNQEPLISGFYLMIHLKPKSMPLHARISTYNLLTVKITLPTQHLVINIKQKKLHPLRM
ncbi:hypothetical protein, partial [Paraliobacillus ryukyuensis]|uniref:hypothetical protein n=1 Tax=Paraliobacillus ryukyuensis TaxID=200904 RepID=UPI0031EBBE5D